MQYQNEQKYLVSVWMVTYNHEKYIAQAIESVLMQRTDFPYQLIIGEDCSTDGTKNIVIKYAEEYPNKIKTILNPKNIGPQHNAANVYKKCTGKYIAMLEGDDYWTHPYKLQKQVDFLEKNRRYSICFHRVNVVDREGKLLYKTKTIRGKCSYTQKDFVFGKYVETVTGSMVFRKDLFPATMPDWFDSVNAGDRFLKILLTEQGNAFVMKDIMGCYRKHDGGIWSSLTWEDHKAKWESDRKVMIQIYGDRYRHMVSYIRDSRGYPFINDIISQGKIRDAWLHFLKIFKHPHFIWIHRGDILKTFAKLTVAALMYVKDSKTRRVP